LLCGGVAGVVSRTVTAPLDRLKVLLQTSTRTHRSFSQIVSIRKGILRIYSDGGILGFFKGNGLNVLKIIPESALKFYCFEHAKDFLSKSQSIEKDELQLGSRLLAGGFAGLVSQFAIYPIETIKTRTMAQITNRPKNPDIDVLKVEREVSITNTIKNLYKAGGLRGFYRGMTPALIGIIPYAGVDLAVFETLKNTWARMRPDDTKMPIPVMLCSGMFSGTCGAVLMYPLALVRTR
jgi:solute carrier family 25 (mitochondrial phosphate transporter), member 23/24/25/41